MEVLNILELVDASNNLIQGQGILCEKRKLEKFSTFKCCKIDEDEMWAEIHLLQRKYREREDYLPKNNNMYKRKNLLICRDEW